LVAVINQTCTHDTLYKFIEIHPFILTQIVDVFATAAAFVGTTVRQESLLTMFKLFLMLLLCYKIMLFFDTVLFNLAFLFFFI